MNTEYEKPDLDFLMFDIVDVITTSGDDAEEDDGFGFDGFDGFNKE